MKERIRELLEENFPDIDFSGDIELIDDGVIDSLSLSVIIAVLTMEFDIMIPKDEIKVENFNTIDAMAALVERLKEKNVQ